jgi:hypothetical protein
MSQGVQIPGADIVGSLGGPSIGPGSGKGKGRVAPQIVLSNTEVSSEEDDIPLQRRMRLLHSGESTAQGPPLSRQQAHGAATGVDGAQRVWWQRIHLDSNGGLGCSGGG